MREEYITAVSITFHINVLDFLPKINAERLFFFSYLLNCLHFFYFYFIDLYGKGLFGECR